MKKIKYFSVILISILLNSFWIFGQQTAKIDSLENLHKKVKGKEKVKVLNYLSYEYIKKPYKSNELLNLIEKS